LPLTGTWNNIRARASQNAGARVPNPEINMSKSHDTKKASKKAPQKTMEEKRQAKRDKKNRPKDFSA